MPSERSQLLDNACRGDAVPTSAGSQVTSRTAPSHFRHFSPEVPDSLHIAAYPFIYRSQQPLVDSHKSAAHSHVFATSHKPTLVHRTQEVVGSSIALSKEAQGKEGQRKALLPRLRGGR